LETETDGKRRGVLAGLLAEERSKLAAALERRSERRMG
jgi:hypothetical protein